MLKSMRFSFDGGPSAVAALHEAAAPVTAATLWEALASPVTVLATHAMYAGPEIMTGLPESARTFDPKSIPPENQQVVPAPGDVIWYYQPANFMAGLSEEVWEVGVFYARGGRVFGPQGWTPCNIFASVTSGLEDFATACADLRVKGAAKLTIARVE